MIRQFKIGNRYHYRTKSKMIYLNLYRQNKFRISKLTNKKSSLKKIKKT